jgi:predicted RNA-binding Zn-ribbon protein involved in translation (DUF1610 family)
MNSKKRESISFGPLPMKLKWLNGPKGLSALQKQQVEFECPECGVRLDIEKLQKEGRIPMIVEYQSGSPSRMVAAVACPSCGKLVNPKTVLWREI